MQSRTQIKTLGIFLGPALFLIVILIPVPQISEDLSFSSKIVLATTLWMAVWWITECAPIYVTALLPLVIFPALKVTSFTETSSNYTSNIIFLFLGGFLLAKAVEKSNLHRRFAYRMLRFFGTDPKFVVLSFMIVTWFLGAWMSNTATAILMLPIALAVISLIKDKDKHHKFVVCLLLAVAYSANISGVSTLIGTPPNAIFASLADSIAGVEVTFGQWMLLGLPISALSLVIIWLYLIRIGSKITNFKFDIFGEKDTIAKNLKDLGPITRDEKVVAFIFIITIAAWITRGILWKDIAPMIDDSMIVIASSISLFLIPSVLGKKQNTKKKAEDYEEFVGYNSHSEQEEGEGDKEIIDSDHKNKKTGFDVNLQASSKKLLDWDTAVTIPWGVLILIGGGLALANGFTSTGLGDWIANQLNFLGNANYFVILLVFVMLAILPTEMISNTATAALLLPISASLAMSMGLNPLLLMAPIAIAASYGFIMPVGTPPNAIVYSSGLVTTKEMARAGLPLDFIFIILVTALTSALVPLVFGI
jgi:sodium-dependent dicarboxylate transporter 2/3/5